MQRLLLVAASVVLASGCDTGTDEESATQRALGELQQKYDELVKDKVDVPVEWATDDLENIGDWEYRVERLSFTTPEGLAAQLNEFGNDRWEVIWLESTPDGFLAIMKKPSISYLSKIPLSELSRFLTPGSGPGE